MEQKLALVSLNSIIKQLIYSKSGSMQSFEFIVLKEKWEKKFGGGR